MFEWDERKRRLNIEKHAIDFVHAARIFETRIVEAPDLRRDYGEQRFGAYGESEGDVLYVIYTWRGDKRRLISARRASTYESEAYHTEVEQAGGRR